MSDYIKREDVMQKFADFVKRSNNSDFVPAPTWNQAVQIVEDIPAADVAPVRHGKWIHEKIESAESSIGFFLTSTCECSLCHTFVQQESKYCPNCGAEMRGAE